MTRTRALLATVLVLLVAPALAAESPTLSRIKKSGTVRLGYSATSVPFSYNDKDGAPTGYSVELCKHIVAGLKDKLGLKELKIQWVALTPADRLPAVEKGRVDMECGTATITLKRQEVVDFSLPIFVDSSTLMTRKDALGGFSAFSGKKIAVAAGTTTEAALERALKSRFVQATVVRTRTVQEGFEKLKAGEVDALAGDRTALIGSFVLGGGAEGLSLIEEDLSYEPYGLLLPRGDADFRLAVNRVLAAIYRSGEITAVYGRWLGPLGKPSGPLVALYLLNSYSE
jgi:glutamate/aspartate transport system substrate-binding protein